MKKQISILIKLSYFALFAYVFMRAIVLSFVHDEGLSYAIIKGDQAIALTANNHFLNTYLMALFSNLFGESEIALRLPNVLAFGFYILGCYKILGKINQVWLLVLANFLLLLNPFVTDFFSLARGYGLSLSFLIWSLYFLIRNEMQYSSYQLLLKDFMFALSLAGIGCMANFSIVNYLIAVVLIFACKYLIFLKTQYKQPVKAHVFFLLIALTATIPLAIAMNRLLLLSDMNQLYYGTDFPGEAMDSLVIESLYFCNFPGSFAIKYVIAALFFSAIVSIVIKKDFSGKFFLITGLAVVMVFGLLSEHYLFGVKYPLSRTSLLFIPIFGLFMCHFAIHISKYYFIKKQAAHTALAFASLGLLGLFLSNTSFTSTYTWKYDAHTKQIMQIIGKQSEAKSNKQTISNDWLYSPAINYYIVSGKLNIALTDMNGPRPTTDYIYKRGDVSDVPNFVKAINFEDTSTVLLRKE